MTRPEAAVPARAPLACQAGGGCPLPTRGRPHLPHIPPAVGTGPTCASTCLVEGDDASDDGAIKAGRFVELGVLEGNIGNQNYELPADVDLGRYRSVSIWSKRFGVSFAAASLEMAS